MEENNVLTALKKVNKTRCNAVYGILIANMSARYWSLVANGSCEELINKLTKSSHYTEDVDLEEVANRVADIVISLDLLCTRLGIDLSSAIRSEFNRVSKNNNTGIFI